MKKTLGAIALAAAIFVLFALYKVETDNFSINQNNNIDWLIIKIFGRISNTQDYIVDSMEAKGITMIGTHLLYVSVFLGTWFNMEPWNNKNAAMIFATGIMAFVLGMICQLLFIP